MCGIISIVNKKGGDVSLNIYDALLALQHRGQDSAGIVTFDGKMHIKKGNGYARDVFKSSNFLRLKGAFGIGHIRYPTAGGYTDAEAQPFITNSPFGIAFAHNGNLTNVSQLKKILVKETRQYFNTDSDSEVMMHFFANEIRKKIWKDGVNGAGFGKDEIFFSARKTMDAVKGAFSVVSLIANLGIVVMRDKYGIRPLSLGQNKKKTKWMIASESAAISALDYDLVRDVEAGEIIFIDMNGNLHSQKNNKSTLSHCIFEHVYLARPDSMIDGISVYHSRLRMGKLLAKKIKKSNIDINNIDVVIPIPETSQSTAYGLATELNLKLREGFVKNRYVGRTFIMPGQKQRKKSIRRKLNTIDIEFRNKNVLLVDDSVVRGNTSKQIVELAKNAGAKNIYFAVASPPLRHPCPYGIDMPKKKDFVANNFTVEEIAKSIGVDGLFYQKLEDLKMSVQAGNECIEDFCTGCFDGKYPIDFDKEEIKKEQIKRKIK